MASSKAAGQHEVEVLASAPTLAPIFARAALTSRRRSGDSLPGRLPERSLRLEEAPVRREHLTAYQRLCGWDLSDRLPHTYPHVLGFPLQAALMAGPGFPLPLVGLVHLENEITVHRPLSADDRLTVTVSARDLRDHPKGRLVDLLTEVDVAGERVWDGRSTYLHRGRPNPDAPRPEPGPALPEGPGSAVWRLPGGLGREYAAVSGDVNPIHLHSLTARAMGFPRAIAHGMWTYARTVAALGPRAAGAATSHVWFRKPVLLPGTVELVVDLSGDPVVVGLRSAKDPTKEHLALTLTSR